MTSVKHLWRALHFPVVQSNLILSTLIFPSITRVALSLAWIAPFYSEPILVLSSSSTACLPFNISHMAASFARCSVSQTLPSYSFSIAVTGRTCQSSCVLLMALEEVEVWLLDGALSWQEYLWIFVVFRSHVATWVFLLSRLPPHFLKGLVMGFYSAVLGSLASRALHLGWDANEAWNVPFAILLFDHLCFNSVCDIKQCTVKLNNFTANVSLGISATTTYSKQNNKWCRNWD